MGILSRFKDIMSANINDLLDKCEDPAKMVDQEMRKLREALADVKRETQEVMADETAAKRRLDECEADVKKYGAAAMKAVEAGSDDDARKLIERKQQCEAKLESAKQVYDAAHDSAFKMRQMHDKLVSDIQSLEDRRDGIKAKVHQAKAQERVNKLSSGMAASEASLSALDRMEAKADRMLDKATAGAELNKPADGSIDDLARKYGEKGGLSSVEDELAAMKASLGK